MSAPTNSGSNVTSPPASLPQVNFNGLNLPNLPNLSNLPVPIMPLQNMVQNTNDPSTQMKSLNQMAPIIMNPADALKAMQNAMPKGIPPLPPSLQALQRTNSCSNLMELQSSMKEKTLQESLEKEQKKCQIIQTAYWSLRSDYQSVCRALKV